MLTEQAQKYLKALGMIADAYGNMATEGPVAGPDGALDRDTCLNGAVIVTLATQRKQFRDHLGEPQDDPTWKGGDTREQRAAAFEESGSTIRRIITKHQTEAQGDAIGLDRELELQELLETAKGTLQQMLKCHSYRELAYMCERRAATAAAAADTNADAE